MNAMAGKTFSARRAAAAALCGLFALALGIVLQAGTAHAYELNADSGANYFSLSYSDGSETTVSGSISGILSANSSKTFGVENNTDSSATFSFRLTNSDGNHTWKLECSNGKVVSGSGTSLNMASITVNANDYVRLTVSNPGTSTGSWNYTLTATAQVNTSSSGSETPADSSAGTTEATAIQAKPGFTDVADSLSYFNTSLNYITCTSIGGGLILNVYNDRLVSAKATIGGKTAAVWKNGYSAWQNVYCTGLKPGTKYPLAITGVIKYNGKYYKGSFLTTSKYVTTESMSAPSVGATKISKNKAFLCVKLPSKEVSKGKYQVILYANGKAIKKFKTNGKTTYRYTYSKAKAGTKKYSAKVVFLASKKYAKKSKAKKPAANVKKYGYSRSVSVYSNMWQGFRPTKAYYKNGKLTVKGFFINTHYYSLSHMKLKFYYMVDGKVAGTKVISTGKMAPHTTKAVTFTCKGSKVKDLRNGANNWRYDLLSWN